LDVIENLPHFIKNFLTKKLHSSLGYVPPEKFEELNKMDYKEEGKDRPKGLTISFIVSSQATALKAQETRVCMINRLFK
jgi:hypothetical protein